MTLFTAQQHFEQFGAAEKCFLADVRSPTSDENRPDDWQPLYRQLCDRARHLHARIPLVFESWPFPDLTGRDITGCCEQHEPDFAIYRTIVWQQLAELWPRDTLDFIEFGASLLPDLQLYFLPGIMSGSLATIRPLSPDFKRWMWRVEEWIECITGPVGRVLTGTQTLTEAQYLAIADYLEIVADALASNDTGNPDSGMCRTLATWSRDWARLRSMQVRS